MTRADFDDRLCRVIQCCDINQRYHQLTQRAWWRWDKIVKAFVVLLAAGALIAAITGESARVLDVGLAATAFVAAVILNVIPVGEWERESGELYRAWCELRITAEQVSVRLIDDDGDPPPHLVERLSELTVREQQIGAQESSPNRQRLLRCQEDHNESVWGAGVRTPEQVRAERKRRGFPDPHCTTASSAEAAQ